MLVASFTLTTLVFAINGRRGHEAQLDCYWRRPRNT